MRIVVNGNARTVSVAASTPLLSVLRHDLGLVGARYGCGEEQCGACVVLIDGRKRPSCRVSIGEVDGCEITTVEGLEPLHPVQRAILAENAAQCGYCTAGLVIAGVDLLDRNPQPTETEIRSALSNHLCRCGAHNRVVRAILRAAGNPASTDTCRQLPDEALVRGVSEIPNRAAIATEIERVDDEHPGVGSLAREPDLDRWISIDADGVVHVWPGKVEIGQGLKTTLARIARDELDLPLATISVHDADTARSPNQGVTAGSMSTEHSSAAVRQAAAEVRSILFERAAGLLDVPAAMLAVFDRAVGTSADDAIPVAELAARGPFGIARWIARPKSPEAGLGPDAPVQRVDLLAKVSGAPAFVHDLRFDGMCYGAVVRPPVGAALGDDPNDWQTERAAAERLPGVVSVVCRGRFLGVVADRPEHAFRAVAQLEASVRWNDGPVRQAAGSLFDRADRILEIVDGSAEGDATPCNAAGAPPAIPFATADTAYERAMQMHASLGPSAACATWSDDRLTVWSHTQGVSPLAGSLASVLSIDAEQVRVVHVEGAGCYGHNYADDVALEAAILAQAVPGRPVLVACSRADEHRFEPYAPPMEVRIDAEVGDDGRIRRWYADLASPTHSRRPQPGHALPGTLLAAAAMLDLAPCPPEPSRGDNGGAHRNAAPLYRIPDVRVRSWFVPDWPHRTSSTRGLGALANVLAIESEIDELAGRAGRQPGPFRLDHLDDPRARAVIEAVLDDRSFPAVSVKTLPASVATPLGTPMIDDIPGVAGSGIGFARYKNRQAYTAVRVELTVATDGSIRLSRALIVADVGRVIDTDAVANQLEGAFLQGAGWTLLEEVRPDSGSTGDWVGYPILRFPQIPTIAVRVIDRPDLPSVGCGEAAIGPAAAAIANAVANATGRRVRKLPLTPSRVRGSTP